jgi:hypothetical protein
MYLGGTPILRRTYGWTGLKGGLGSLWVCAVLTAHPWKVALSSDSRDIVQPVL